MGGARGGSSKPTCRYGASCYRTNPEHFIDFAHPHLDAAAAKPKAKDRPSSRSVELSVEALSTSL